MTRTDPTGEQVLLKHRGPRGEVTARIAQVGAALRGLTVGGTDLVAGYPDGSPAPGASGTVLVPWPNRVRDGRWTQHGVTRQLAISEPRLGNASHGLLRFAPYAVRADAARAELAAFLPAQTGYPFPLDTRVVYALVDDGIEVTHRIRNVGTEDAPVAVGAHPYLAVGDTPAADLTLRVPGRTWFALDERNLPLGEHDVDPETDLRDGRPLRGLALDRAYGKLDRDADGRVRTTLAATDGRVVTLWQGEWFDYTQVFTTTEYPGRPLAVAVEPMTAPADAFNSGQGLRWLAPGEEWELSWGIALSA